VCNGIGPFDEQRQDKNNAKIKSMMRIAIFLHSRNHFPVTAAGYCAAS
jgi:hypothetical protein